MRGEFTMRGGLTMRGGHTMRRGVLMRWERKPRELNKRHDNVYGGFQCEYRDWQFLIGPMLNQWSVDV